MGAAMSDSHVLSDYEPVRPLGETAPPDAPAEPAPERGRAQRAGRDARRETPRAVPAESWAARRGHLVSYIGLFFFTAFVFFRPYELFSIPGLKEGALWLALFTLLAYVPSQFMAEGNLTARPREVNLALLLLLAALLSVPFAISPGEAWENFVEFSKVILMFVVLVNVARTEWRFRGLLLLAMSVSVLLSFAAFNDYRHGRLELGGERVKGLLGGLFDNPNDLALHLVTMVPLAVGLAFARRGLLIKLVYGLCAALFVAGVVVTFSRAGFLGLLAGAGVLAWKLGRRHRLVVAALIVISLGIFTVAMPGDYGLRVTSIFGGDTTGSVSARRDLLWRSVVVALRYPITGVGLGNFYYRGAHDQVSHNAYTQVASEMGLAAFVVYVMFLVTPIRRLRRVERETFAEKKRARFYYLSIGLQASIVGYMVSSFFASVAHLWYVYYIVGYSLCLRRLYALEFGEPARAGGEAGGRLGGTAPAAAPETRL
jgi:O-antigen ligase